MSNKKKHDLEWSFTDKFCASLTILAIFLSIIWFLLPSSLFIKPVSLKISGDDVVFVREVPLGEVSAAWRSEIVVLDHDDLECDSNFWSISFYQHAPANRVRYKIGDWAKPCIAAGKPYYITTFRHVLLFGVIPLRGFQTTTLIGEIQDVS